MATEPITFFTSDTLLLKYIILTLDSTRTLADLNTYTSNHQLLYEIYSLLSGGAGTGGILKFGFVIADGTVNTVIADLDGKTIDTNFWVFHTGTKRDSAMEVDNFTGDNLEWVAGWEPAIGTRIDYFYY